MSAPTVTDPDLESVAWDLSPLLQGAGEDDAQATADRLLEESQVRADAFAERYAGKVGELDGPGLAEAMRELAELHDVVGRVGNYAMLWFSTDTADPRRGALLQRIQERGTQIETRLLFWDLEWAAVEDARADELLAHPDLEFARHHLRTARRYRPHLLSEPEERIHAEKSLTASSAWTRLFAEQASAIRVDLDEPEETPLELALARLHDADRSVRAHAAERITAALQPGLRTRAFVFNTLLADKMVDDRLRGYPHWLSARNLSNEASDESVQALVDAVVARYELPRRWYRLKAQMLGVERLADYDRMAAVTQDEERFGWNESVELVMDSYRTFSGELGDVAQEFFSSPYIDAPPRPGKRGGAFCAYTVPSAHPYLMLNHTGRRRDVLTLAHELGHGVHASLARPQGIFHQGTPLTLA